MTKFKIKNALVSLTDKNKIEIVAKKLKELDINPLGDFLYLSYDSPYKFYNRRNEVVVAIKDFEKNN